MTKVALHHSLFERKWFWQEVGETKMHGPFRTKDSAIVNCHAVFGRAKWLETNFVDGWDEGFRKLAGAKNV
jgi:hypothetical protein